MTFCFLRDCSINYSPPIQPFYIQLLFFILILSQQHLNIFMPHLKYPPSTLASCSYWLGSLYVYLPLTASHSSVFLSLAFAFTAPQKLLLWVNSKLPSAYMSVATSVALDTAVTLPTRNVSFLLLLWRHLLLYFSSFLFGNFFLRIGSSSSMHSLNDDVS